tara:strand:+ start:2566 stop:3342 length:777 start_codon:yes stop_codon:yes gene_type:complete
MSNVTDFTIDNASGQSVRLDIQACLKALQSSNSSTSDLSDSQSVAGMWFLRSDNNTLKIRGSGNSFTTVGSIDQANLGLLPRSGGTMTGVLKIDDSSSASTPALSFDGDTDTGLFRVTTNTIGISSAGSQTSQFDASGLTLLNQLDLRFRESTSNGTNYVGFQAPASITSNQVWTLPASDAAVSGYALVSNASGVLSWAAAGGGAVGGGSNEIFWENDQIITQNYTITNGKNAGSFGPITIQSGVTVTVGAGETWTVV